MGVQYLLWLTFFNSEPKLFIRKARLELRDVNLFVSEGDERYIGI